MRNSNGNTFSFIPHVRHFSYFPWITASEGRSLTTHFSTKMRGRKQPQEHQGPSRILLEFRHYSPPLSKNIKNLRSMRKFKHARHLHWHLHLHLALTLTGLCIFLVQMLKTVSISFINSELVRTLYLVWLLSNL